MMNGDFATSNSIRLLQGDSISSCYVHLLLGEFSRKVRLTAVCKMMTLWDSEKSSSPIKAGLNDIGVHFFVFNGEKLVGKNNFGSRKSYGDCILGLSRGKQ